MNFRFLTIGCNGAIDTLGDIDLDEQVVEPIPEIERRFEELARSLEVGQVIVLCPSLGKPPGLIVAIERVSIARTTSTRQLKWLMAE